MDNSFKPQGEFMPDGEFKPDGEFNAPQPPREFIKTEPAKIVRLPHDKMAKAALIVALVGIVFFFAGTLYMIPAIWEALYAGLGAVGIYALFIAWFVLCVVIFALSVGLSTKGVFNKHTKSVWAAVLSLVFTAQSIVILVSVIRAFLHVA